TLVAFNHSGDLLASVGWDGMVRFWDPLSGKQLVSSPFPDGSRVQFSPDDQLLAFMRNGSKIGLLEVATGHECRTLHGHTGYKGPWGVDFSPTGRLLASASHDGVRLWDLAFNKEIALLPVGPSHSVLFLPDGTSLIAFGPSGLWRWPV